MINSFKVKHGYLIVNRKIPNDKNMGMWQILEEVIGYYMFTLSLKLYKNRIKYVILPKYWTFEFLKC